MDSIQMLIPKTIHYCWFGGKNKPKSVRDCISSWRKKCPDYQIIEWNETNFDVESHPFTKSAYQQKAWAFVSDYARLKIIYDNGGIYLDTDVELLKSLDDFLHNDCYVGLQQQGNYCATGLGFGAKKKSIAVKHMLDSYNELTFSSENASAFACPILNTQALLFDRSIFVPDCFRCKEVAIYGSKYFDPVSPGKDVKNLLCDDSVSLHHYDASWMGWKARTRRRLLRSISRIVLNGIIE